MITSMMLMSRVIKAQFYSSYTHYYVKVGDDLNENTEILMFSFDGEKMKHMKAKRSAVRSNLKKNSSYYDDKFINARADGKYNEGLSTTARTTYQRSEGGTQTSRISSYNPYTGDVVWDFNTVGAIMYKYSFSNDKSSLIRWTNANNRVYYKAISEAEILSNEEYDFLQ